MGWKECAGDVDPASTTFGVTSHSVDRRSGVRADGEIGGIGRQLTRSMGDVDSIEVLRNENAGEIALRMSHGAGQTLLTLTE